MEKIDPQDVRLMEMDVPCGCHTISDQAECNLDCTGTRKPLQKPCPCIYRGEIGATDYLCPPCIRHFNYRHDTDCDTCCGTNLVPNISLETMMEAIRAKGWRATLIQTVEWDRVVIMDFNVSGLIKPTIAIVEPDDDLRGRDALALALIRALEGEHHANS